LPENRRFIGLTLKKRVLAALLIITVPAAIAEVLSRPDPARVEREQYDVLSAYLFDVPLYSRPLPVVCAEDHRYTRGTGITEIHQYFVLKDSISAPSQPSTFSHLVERKIQAPEASIAVLNSWFLLNLSTERFTDGFSGVGSERLVLMQTQPDLSSARQPSLVARFTRVGFNHDFTMAMLYAEVSCGGASSKEYAYLAKAHYPGRGWYWYVYRVDPASWNTLVLEHDPGPSKRHTAIAGVLFWMSALLIAVLVITWLAWKPIRRRGSLS
jgi:hypothetical protein